MMDNTEAIAWLTPFDTDTNLTPDHIKAVETLKQFADRIIAEEADDDALGIAYKKGFEDGKARGKCDCLRQTNAILDYLKARGECTHTNGR